MAGYYGIIQSVVKRGYDAFQLTFRVNQVQDTHEVNSTVQDKFHGETYVYRVDVAVEKDRLILFPDRELAQCLTLYRNSSDRSSDTDWKKWHDVGQAADRLCRHVSSLLFEKDNHASKAFPSQMDFHFKMN